MISQELLQDIKTQLQSGQTQDNIKANLLAKGFQASDVESAFQATTTSSSSVSKTNVPAKRFLPIIIILIIVFLAVIIGEAIAIFKLTTDNKSVSEVNLTRNQIPGVITPLNSSPSPIPTNPEESIFYSSPEQGYGFQYIKSWKIDKLGTLTVLANPNNPNSQQCAAVLEKLLACDAMISTNPYMSSGSAASGVIVSGLPPIKPQEEQVRDLATQLAVGNNIAPITLGSLKGYEAPSTNTEGSTYNIVLQGSKNMILVQFLNKKSQNDLDKGLMTVFNSVIEQ